MGRHRLWITVLAVSLGGLAGGVIVMISAVRAGTPAVAPVLALVVIGAAVGVPLALRHPDLALVSLIVTDLARLSEISAELIGVGIFQPLLGLAVVSVGLGLIRGRLRLQWSPIYLLALALFAVRGLTVLVSGGGEEAVAAVVETAKDFVYLAVVIVWVATHRSLRLATGVLVATMAILAALSVVQEFVFGNTVGFLGLSNVQTTQLGAVTLRHSGPESDPNFWGRSLVLTLPIALSWWATAGRVLLKWVAAGAVAAIGLGLYLTQSRGGLIAAMLAVLFWVILAGRPYVRWLALAPVALAVLLVIPGVGSRLVTLTDITAAEQGAGDPSLQGRVGAQRAGIGMFLDNPVLGVGVGEFRMTVPEYQRKLGIRAEVLDAHNLVLEIAAESGAIGLTAWGLFLGFGVFAPVRVWLVSGPPGSGGDRWSRFMAVGVISGVVGWLAASAFLHAASLRVLYTVLAIGVGMDLVLRDRFRVADAGAVASGLSARAAAASLSARNRPRVPLIQQPAVIGVLVFFVFATGSWFAFGSAPRRWVAERQVVVIAGEDADGRYLPYSYDLITRGLVGTTYAAVLEDAKFTRGAAADLGWDMDDLGSTEVSASYAPASQVITVRVAGDDPNHVRGLAARIIARGTGYVAGLDEPFVVAAVDPDSTDVQRGSLTDLTRIALIVVMSTVAALEVGGLVGFARRSSGGTG